MSRRPTHFEIPVDDPDRAEAFYTAVFGWEINRYEGAPSYYGLATTGESNPGINGALYQRQPDQSTVLTMSVDSVDDAVATIVENGGSVAQPKMAIPSMGWYATCEDTEGNRIGVFAEDASAQM
jgi:predicted enzyme related to lactoylglutathione lyase